MTRYVPLVAALWLSACASLPLKQQAVQSLQISETALESAHDIERSICFVTPATEQGGHCTNAAAATFKLTDASHQKLASLFDQAFAAEIKAATALKAWTAGAPAPTDLASYQADITAILTLTKQLDPSATAIVVQAQSAVDAGAAVAAAVGVK